MTELNTAPQGNEEAVVPQVATPTVAMISTLGLVSAICGLIIVTSYQVTQDAVKENQLIKEKRAVERVMPTAKSVVGYYMLSDHKVEVSEKVDSDPKKYPADGKIKFFAGYDAGGSLLGIAAEASAKGYADQVRVMYAYSEACQCINGMTVVAMKETPGIGDKADPSKEDIVDKEFMKNFVALDVKLSADLKTLAHEVKTVKHGKKTNPWEIDAIAGATVTSRAVGNGINQSAQALLPKLVPSLEAIRSMKP